MSTIKGPSSQVNSSSQEEMKKKIRYDYSKLDEFFQDNFLLLPDELAESFTRLFLGYATLLAQAMHQGAVDNVGFYVPEGTTSHMELLIEFFDAIKTLKEVKS